MKLSIITVTYQNLSGLQRTVKSVREQTFRDYELLVIDGGSTDGTVEWLQSEGVKPISTMQNSEQQIWYVSEKDGGIYDAQNKGIMLAKGEYCYFLNAGDELLQNNILERMMQDATADIVYGNELETYYNGQGQIEQETVVRGVEQPTLMDLYSSCMKHQASFIKRQLFEQYGSYDVSLRMCADWDWFFRVIGFHNEVSLQYRNVNIARFEAGGFSYTHPEIEKKETEIVRGRYIPKRQQADIDFFLKYERLRDADKSPFLRFILKSVMWIVKRKRSLVVSR